MDNLKPALEKLFNTLGNQMTDDYYGLTFDFNIKDVKPSDYNHEILKITVSTNPPIPSTLFVEDSPWGYGKFSTGNYLTWNLENLTKYLGLGTDMVVVDVDNMEKVEDFSCDAEVLYYREGEEDQRYRITFFYTQKGRIRVKFYQPYRGLTVFYQSGDQALTVKPFRYLPIIC